MKTKAAVINEPNADFSFEELELQEPQFGQILVKVVASGVCHTDEMGKRYEPHCQSISLPVVLGHEGAGIVEKVGPGVKSVVPGDHVVMTFPSCGVCDNCRSGHPAFCSKSFQLCFTGRFEDGTTPLSRNGQPVSNFFGQSSFATYAVVDESGIVKIDKDVDLKVVAPLGCGIQTGAGAVINIFRPMPGDSFVVFGSGTVGMAAVMAAKACGCTTIVAVDVVPSRLEKALELGATHVINSKETPDMLGELRKIKPEGFDFSFDTTGIAPCYKAAGQCLHWTGKTAGCAVTGEIKVDDWKSWFGGHSFHSVIEGDSMPQVFIPRLINMYKAGIFPFDKLEGFFPFEKIDEAFEASHNGSVFKPVLVME